jgi:hypothetical protein
MSPGTLPPMVKTDQQSFSLVARVLCVSCGSAPYKAKLRCVNMQLRGRPRLMRHHAVHALTAIVASKALSRRIHWIASAECAHDDEERL